MLKTSEEYQKAVRQSTRTSAARIVFGVADVTANGDASPTATTSQPFTPIQAILDDVRNPPYIFGTFEQDYFRLDGSMYLMPDNVSSADNLGWWSAKMSIYDGSFPRGSVQTITIAFTGTHSSLGLCLFFGEEYCIDFDVTWYNGTTLLAQEQIQNDSPTAIIPRAVDNYNKIVVNLKRTRNPFRYARLSEIYFGLEQVFDSDHIISASVIEEVDPSASVLSVNSLKFTVLNEDQKFNMLNPEGIYAFLQQRQKISAYSGLLLPDGSYEYVSMGTFYLSDWKNSTGLTATLEASDAIGMLDKTTYWTSPFWVNEPVTNVLNHILADAGNNFKLKISDAAKAEVVNGYIPIKSHREAVMDVILATKNVLKIDRDNGYLFVDKVNYNSAVEEINYNTIIGTPTIEQKPLITSVELIECSYKLNSTVRELYNSTFNVTGTQTMIISLGLAASNLAITVTGGTIVGSPIYSAVGVKVTITANGSVTVVVNGKDYIETKRTITSSAALLAGEVPQVATVAENKLFTASNSKTIADNLLTYYRRRIKQTFEYWDNPSIQAGDTVDVETIFKEFSSGVVERQEITFAPSLKGRIEVVG